MKSETAKVIAKIAIPIAIGVAVVSWLFGREFNARSLSAISLSTDAIPGLALALVCLFGRDFGLAWRFKSLTDNRLSWKSSTKVTMLCEFTSAITPTSVGGSALSMIFLGKEGINMGRATAITLTTLFLDELLFVVCCPLLFLFVTPGQLFGFTDGATAHDLMIVFWVVYSLLVLITAGLYLGLFHIPHKIAKGLIKLFSINILRRWQPKVEKLGDDLVAASKEIKKKRLGWWWRPCLATIITWVSRFFVVNALFMAFFPEADQGVVFGRQFIVWALLIFTPTPGGSGVSEMLFKSYYSDVVHGPLLMVMAIIWRVLTYYIFLAIGFCMIPSFLKLSSHKNATKQKNQ